MTNLRALLAVDDEHTWAALAAILTGFDRAARSAANWDVDEMANLVRVDEHGNTIHLRINGAS